MNPLPETGLCPQARIQCVQDPIWYQSLSRCRMRSVAAHAAAAAARECLDLQGTEMEPLLEDAAASS